MRAVGSTLRCWAAAPAAAALLLASGCGGGGDGANGGTSLSAPALASANAVPIIVDSGPPGAGGVVNTPYVSVTICAPGTSNCVLVDHVTVDTGSSGLRVMASVLPSGFALPQANTSAGQPLVECEQFADGFSWGPVKSADVKIAGKEAAGIPIQVIGDPAFPNIPSDCSSSGPAHNTVAQFGGNGVLGVSVFAQDCGAACAAAAVPGTYYGCPVSGCAAQAIPLAQQLPNPVTRFAGDQNGVVIRLAPVGAAGAASVGGTLIFGIATQSNNALGSASILGVDPSTGNLTTVLNGATLAQSFIDSGSNALFFPDRATSVCPSAGASGFYCPAAVQSLSATLQSSNGNGVARNVAFNVADADALFNGNPSFAAFNNLAGPATTAGGFDWGLPFFFGRNVYVAIEGQNTSVGAGPFVAF